MVDLQELHPVAGRQYGLFTNEQASAAGVSKHQLRQMVTAGRARRLRRAVYAFTSWPDTWHQRVMRAVLSGPPGTVASHMSAGALWKIPEIPPEGHPWITVSLNAGVRITGYVRRTGSLPPEDIATRAGIPTTSMARTLVDLSALQSPGQLGRALDDAIRRHATTVDKLDACVSRLEAGPWRKTTVIRDLIDLRRAQPVIGESNTERRWYESLLRAELPAPVPQFWVKVAGRRYRLDFAYPEVKLAIEVDGFDPHNTRTAFDKDRARANDLVAAGWTVLRFTSESTQAHIASSVRATLARLTQAS